MRPDARAWFQHRTSSAPSTAALDLPALLRAKRRGGHRVSVVLPARNEAATVGRLVADVVRCWNQARASGRIATLSTSPGRAARTARGSSRVRHAREVRWFHGVDGRNKSQGTGS